MKYIFSISNQSRTLGIKKKKDKVHKLEVAFKMFILKK